MAAPANNVNDRGNSSRTNGPDSLGPGHTSVLNPAESSGEFLGLRTQKNAAQAHTANRVAESGGFVDERIRDGTLKETCDTEDHSFMGRKPGPATLMGSSVLKDAVDR